MAASAPPKPEELQQLSQEWDGRISENNHVEPSARTKIAASVVASLLVIAFIVCFGFFIYTRPSERYGIILFIGDGFGPASATLARTMLNRSLSLDPYLVGTVRTFSASSLITDSAAAATAYACGEKTNNGWVSVLPDGTPCRTLLEAAQDAGWRVGLIATTDLTDATPAAFSAHVNARGNMSEIADQQLQHKIDVMIGGGKLWYAPLASKATELGVTLTADWLDVKNKRVQMPFVAALTDGRMPYMIDRPADTSLPTLEACFDAAIEYLTSDDKPFFLMVEGSRIDHAGHGNDPAAQWMEVGAFDAAFDAAVKWAHAHTGVAVVSTADHETGGLTIGRDPTLFGKPLDYAWDPSVIRAVKASGERMNQLLGVGWKPEAVQAIMVEYANLQITEAEYDYMLKANMAGVAANGITRVISHRAGLEWTTLGHTGVDVNLYTAGAAPRFHGSVDNTAVGRALAALHKFEIGRMHTKR